MAPTGPQPLTSDCKQKSTLQTRETDQDIIFISKNVTASLAKWAPRDELGNRGASTRPLAYRRAPARGYRLRP